MCKWQIEDVKWYSANFYYESLHKKE